jgi:general secretion pathway protein G
MKKAFTMIELVFVIVIIGILSAVAIPKLAPMANLANDARAKSTLATVRGALSTQRQKLILQGEFGKIKKLRNGKTGVFTKFVYVKNDNDTDGIDVLEYDVKSCKNGGCWNTQDGITYTYYKSSINKCTFKLENNKFNDTTDGSCTGIAN